MQDVVVLLNEQSTTLMNNQNIALIGYAGNGGEENN
jgi:hypothetical protein